MYRYNGFWSPYHLMHRIGSNIIANQEPYILSYISLENFLSMGIHDLIHMKDTLQELTTTLKREGFFLDILIRNLRKEHHAQEEDSIGSIHPHENNTLIISLLVEDEEP
jgi:hypothetical protein